MGSGFDIDGYFNSGRVVASSSNLTENYPNNSISKHGTVFQVNINIEA